LNARELKRQLSGHRIGFKVCSAAALFALTVPATLLAAAGPSSAGITSPDQADHWGRYFGAHNSRDDDQVDSPSPMNFPAPVAQVGSSNSSQYALLTNGTLWAWGQGRNGELGNGTDNNAFSTPVKVKFPRGVKIALIATDAMPYDTAFAVDTTGRAWGWGLNSHGELCLGTKTSYNRPRRLPLNHVTALAGANGHAVYDAGGTLLSCGSNPFGVLGAGLHVRSSFTPVKVKGLPSRSRVTALVAGYGNDGALLANGNYYDWGMNTSGQLGIGSQIRGHGLPVQVTLPGPVAAVAQGGSTPENGQTLVKLADGSLYAWGCDTHSQLGDGQTSTERSPIPLVPPAGVSFTALATGGATSYGLTASGQVYAWGGGSAGQIGNGKTVTETRPVLVDSGASLVSSTANDVVVAAGAAGAAATHR
jgi:alpha-tubulin suppressor-like RCC1 family protein